MHRALLFLILVMISSVVNAEPVRVAVASNFLATLNVLVPLYEQQSGNRLVISSGSSGKLYAQIMHGAPYDVFLSADAYYPDKLVEQDKALEHTNITYARGVLVLWAREASLINAKFLHQKEVKHIAIANPKTAPYGLAAQQALRNMDIFDRVKHKFVKGENVGQAFQFVASGNAQIGFVALSQVLNPNNTFHQQYWQIPLQYYEPIEQQAVVIKRKKDQAAAKQFMNFLMSAEARRIIKEFGYL